MGASYTYRHRYSPFDAFLLPVWPNEYLWTGKRNKFKAFVSPSVMIQFLISKVNLKNKTLKLEYLKVGKTVFSSYTNCSSSP